MATQEAATTPVASGPPEEVQNSDPAVTATTTTTPVTEPMTADTLTTISSDAGCYVGEVEGGTPNGQGTFTFANPHCVVTGTFAAGQTCGKGTIKFVDKPECEHLWKAGLSIQLIISSDTSQKPDQQRRDVAQFRSQLTTWQSVQFSVQPPVWSVEQIVTAINKQISEPNDELFMKCASIPIPTDGLVLTIPDLQTSEFITIPQALYRTSLLEMGVQFACKGQPGFKDVLPRLLTQQLTCSDNICLAVSNLILDLSVLIPLNITDPYFQKEFADFCSSLLSHFKKKTVDSLLAQFSQDLKTLIVEGNAGPNSVHICRKLVKLFQMQKAEHDALHGAVDEIQLFQQRIEEIFNDELAQPCLERVADLFGMTIADEIMQKMQILDKCVTFIEKLPDRANPDVVDAISVVCSELKCLDKSTEAIDGLREMFDFWELALLCQRADQLHNKEKRVVRAISKSVKLKCSKTLFTFQPVNEYLVNRIHKGDVTFLGDLFSSCDNLVHTFTAQIFPLVALPWSSPHSPDDTTKGFIGCCDNTTCAALTRLLVLHSTAGSTSPGLRQESIRLLCRLLSSDSMKEVLIEESSQGIVWLARLLPLFQGTMTTRLLGLAVMAVLASSEDKFKDAVCTHIGWKKFYDLMQHGTAGIEKYTEEEKEQVETTSAQILGCLCGKAEYLQKLPEGALEAVISFARSGRISLHREINLSELTIGRELGRGAHAIVKEAVWKGQKVALKIFSESAMDFRFEDFLTELAILSLTRHPNIMRLHGAVVQSSADSESTYMLVTELLPGGTLEKLCRGAPLEQLKVLKYATHVARGMAHLHSLNMIHRDLKTANCLLDSQDNVKVADLGLSRVVNKLAMTGGVGTPKWEAPECLGTNQYTRAADVYSYAIVVWEMVTGQEPFPDVQSIFELKKLVCDKKKRPEIPPTCSSLLRELLKVCWHPNPKKRPTFSNIAEKLSLSLAKYDPTAAVPTPPTGGL
ncbi:TKL protein kinase [Pelomyxa schiedti]|nr:TKL protein kinase [Pelomyxa schiedti]